MFVKSVMFSDLGAALLANPRETIFSLFLLQIRCFASAFFFVVIFMKALPRSRCLPCCCACPPRRRAPVVFFLFFFLSWAGVLLEMKNALGPSFYIGFSPECFPKLVFGKPIGKPLFRGPL